MTYHDRRRFLGLLAGGIATGATRPPHTTPPRYHPALDSTVSREPHKTMTRRSGNSSSGNSPPGPVWP